MVKNIVFYNFFHIGDVWLSKGIIKAIMDQNPSKTFTYFIHAGGALYSDMPQLKIMYTKNNTISPLISDKFTTYAYLDDDTVAINTWIGSISNGYDESTTQIECVLEKIQQALKFQIERANMDGAELEFMPVALEQLLPTIPPLNIEKFHQWRVGRKCVLYHNYLPRSFQKFTIKNHDTVIMELAESNPDIDFVIASYSAVLASCGLPNVIYVGTILDCKESHTCENIVTLAHVALKCDFSINFEIGACMTYVNSSLFLSKVVVLAPSSYDDYHFHARLRTNFLVSDSEYEKRVRFIPINDRIVDSISEQIKTAA